jgi:predicted lipoprotein with Yx(FWY)xxD motif
LNPCAVAAVLVGDGAPAALARLVRSRDEAIRITFEEKLVSGRRIQKRVIGTLAGVAMASASVLSLGVGTASASSHGAKVMLRSTKDGKVLVTSTGRSLYDFSIDRKNKSNCDATCRAFWHPLKTSGKPVAGAGVKKSLLGQTSGHQVTYNGHPLYTYVEDTKAGSVKGERAFASGGYWYLMNAKGKSVL